jgi:hypothetical protein
MIPLVLLLVGAMDAGELAPRLETLQAHFERLQEIPVAEDLADERRRRLEAVETAIQAPITIPQEVNDLYLRMDEVRQWLWANTASRPTVVDGSFTEDEKSWSVENGVLQVTIAKETLAMEVTTPAGHTWAFAPSSADIESGGGPGSLAGAHQRNASAFNTGFSHGMIIRLMFHVDGSACDFRLGIHLEGNEMVCTLSSDADALAFQTVTWPPRAVLPATSEVSTVVPLMQGMLLPGDFPEAVIRKDLAHSRVLYMPWWGQTHGKHGMLTILETDDDGGVRLNHAAGGPTAIEPLWYSSMGKLRYMRRVRLIFEADQDYVSFAKRYRQYVQEQGRFVSLREKLVRTPRLASVIGSPVIHTSGLYHNVAASNYYNHETLEANHALRSFDTVAADLKGLHERGIERAYVHLDGWGFYGYDSGHPDVLPPGAEQGGWEGLKALANTCHELGWIFAIHDNYRDFYLNAASYDTALSKQDPGGDLEEHSIWCGGPQTILSAVWAPGYVRRNHDLFAVNGVQLDGAYLDVFSIVPLEESYQDIYPMTRSDCAVYRKQCLDLLRARGDVVSSEEPVDEFLPNLDLVHHAPWFTFNEKPGIPIPLFSLVYHDAILVPWTMSEAGGWGIRDEDAGRLHCLLNAGLPYLDPGASPEQIIQVQEAAELAKRLAHEPMTNHEFVEGNLRRQRTTFGDGTQILVDFDAKTCEIGALPQVAE